MTRSAAPAVHVSLPTRNVTVRAGAAPREDMCCR